MDKFEAIFRWIMTTLFLVLGLMGVGACVVAIVECPNGQSITFGIIAIIIIAIMDTFAIMTILDE